MISAIVGKRFCLMPGLESATKASIEVDFDPVPRFRVYAAEAAIGAARQCAGDERLDLANNVLVHGKRRRKGQHAVAL